MTTPPIAYSHSNKRVPVTQFNAKFSELVEHHNPFDQSSPISLINLLPDSLKCRFNTHSVQEYMRLGEEAIEEKLKPETTLRRLRLSLWGEFCKYQDMAVFRGKRMSGGAGKQFGMGIDKICFGVCYPKYFYDKVMTNDLALAYIFTPPVSYEITVKESLDLGFKRLRDILNFPIYKETRHKDGTSTIVPDTSVADIILKTVALLDLRIHGAIPKVVHQSVESRNVNLNMNKEVDVDIDAGLMDVEDLDKRIQDIRKETKETLHEPIFSLQQKDYILKQAEGPAGNE